MKISKQLKTSACGGKYTVCFDNFKVYEEAMKMTETAISELNPESVGKFDGWDYVTGYFIKDGIRVYMEYASMLDYLWQIDTCNPEAEKKVLGWADAVLKKFKSIEKTQESHA